MGWLEGLLTGYADRNSEIRQQNAAAAEAATGREAAIYKALLDSPDPKIKATAAVGLMQTAQPNKLKGGFGGWLGQMEEHPAYAPLVKYMSTPQQVGEDVKTTTTTPQQAGYLPTLPSNKPAAQTATQTTTPGAPGPQPTLPMPASGPPPVPPAPMPGVPVGLTGTVPPVAMPGVPASLTGTIPPVAMPSAPPAPPTGLLGSLPGGAPRSPAGFPTSPDGTTFVQQLEPPSADGSNGGHWVDDKGQHWTMSNDEILKVGETPVAVGGPLHGGPPAMPPGGPAAPLGPDQLRNQLAPETAPAPLTQTTRTPIMGLPHAFPTHAESLAADEQAKMHAEISTMQEAYHAQGDPDWQKKGFDAYMSQHSRATPGVMEGDSQPVSGALARQLGVPDGTYMQPLYDKTTGSIVHWIPAGAKSAGRSPTIMDRALHALGYNSISEVTTPAAEAAVNAKAAELLKSDSASRAGGAAQGKYAFEQSRLDPKAVDYAARGIAADSTLASVLLTGRPQAFKDEVLKRLAAKGVTVQKLDDATRSMATMAKDLSPIMDKIAADAKKLDAAGMMGPISSRWNDFLSGTLGAAEAGAKDPAMAGLFTTFRTEAAFLQSGVARAHTGARGAGSPYMLEHMDNLLSAGRMDYPTFVNSMAGFKVFMDQYKEHLPDWGTLPGTPGVEPEDIQPGAIPNPSPVVPPTAGAPDANKAAAALASGKKLYTAPSGNVYVNGKLATKAGAH